jgi:aminopeptidase
VTDPRVERLAGLVAGYSLELGEGDVVRLDGTVCAQPLLLALYRAALERGARPYLEVEIEGLDELLLEEASEEQLAFVSPVDWKELELLDAHVTVWADENTRALSHVDPGRRSRRYASRRELSNRRWERITAGELRWCGTLFPTHGHAQDADMSLAEFEEFVFRACHVEDGEGDAERHWRETAGFLTATTEQLQGSRELHVVGPDTDLRLGVAGRRWLTADGHLNMPDGEVFTSPVETETDGEIRFELPAVFEGREVRDVRLRFEGGSVVRAEAAEGDSYLQALLEIEGARVLGEAAFGLNYEIERHIGNTLFDEKIGGTMHFALGSAFALAGGLNVSGLHWDLICDLRQEGEVYADGELVWKAGRFLEGGGTDG